MITKHFHFSVLLAAMDIISRYQPLLIPLDSLHYNILAIFMKSLNVGRTCVRAKSVNLLSRFVSGVKQGIIPYQQGILEAIQGLIQLPSPADVQRHANELQFYEANYPLFFITSSIIGGPWNNYDDVYGFYHVCESDE